MPGCTVDRPTLEARRTLHATYSIPASTQAQAMRTPLPARKALPAARKAKGAARALTTKIVTPRPNPPQPLAGSGCTCPAHPCPHLRQVPGGLLSLADFHPRRALTHGLYPPAGALPPVRRQLCALDSHQFGWHPQAPSPSRAPVYLRLFQHPTPPPSLSTSPRAFPTMSYGYSEELETRSFQSELFSALGPELEPAFPKLILVFTHTTDYPPRLHMVPPDPLLILDQVLRLLRGSAPPYPWPRYLGPQACTPRDVQQHVECMAPARRFCRPPP